MTWPSADALEETACEVAREMLREEGIALAGFERVLALAAREPLARAREIDEQECAEGSLVVGSEVDCRLAVRDPAGGERELRLRIDRVDREGDALRLTDYKTGRPAVSQSGEARRRTALLEAVGSGQLLQAPAYAAVVRVHGGASGLGRYLHLHADATERTRDLSVGAHDEEVAHAFDGAIRRALAAWDAGSFFPRLFVRDGERRKDPCRSCAFKEACLKHDSSARGRLERWTASPLPHASAAEAALLDIWRPEAAR